MCSRTSNAIRMNPRKNKLVFIFVFTFRKGQKFHFKDMNQGVTEDYFKWINEEKKKRIRK